ncbi:MAG TPA: hypothetical protein VJ946_14855, partial [Bacteroidales bacterium]|nr:hypothetical protein [Bacteroidales bacterium]
SHNPADHNGFKVSGPNAAPVGYDDGLKAIEELIRVARSLCRLKNPASTERWTTAMHTLIF